MSSTTNLKMSENTDDLEQTLMLAAAAADSRQYEEAESPDHSQQTEEIKYYTDGAFEHLSEELPEKKSNLENEERSAKRKAEEQGGLEKKSHAQVVATHYNLIEDKGLEERSRRRIIYMCNFHNWIKSMLINEYLTKIRDAKRQHNPPIRVHDMCCGKGGDLLKWKKGNISHLICSDIADVSLEHCSQRYADMKQRSMNERGRNSGHLFSMEIVHGDAGKVRLREKFADPSLKLDLVSCQFAFHYSFESLPQAECMMKNAAECLQPGGYFIGTIPDSNEIIARARKSSTASFGNDVFCVTPDFDVSKAPLFGAKYDFQLEGAVNCPEFLVHFPTFIKLAKQYGLKLVRKEKFFEFFERMKEEGKQLLTNMRALENYPPTEGQILVGDAPDDYAHAKERLGANKDCRIGTLSKSEWEASSLYLTFVFEKVKNTWNADGTPCYDI